MPPKASEPVREHGDGVSRGRRVRCHFVHRNGTACRGGVQHVPATARGRRRLDYVNQWGQGAAAPCPNVVSEFDRR